MPLFPSAACSPVISYSFALFSADFTYIHMFHSPWLTNHANTSPECDGFDAATKRRTLMMCLSCNSSREKVCISIHCGMIYLLFIHSTPGDIAVVQNVSSRILHAECDCKGAAHQLDHTSWTNKNTINS